MPSSNNNSTPTIPSTELLLEAKKEYTERLLDILEDPIFNGFHYMYNNAKDLCQQENTPTNVLMVFQDSLERVSKWTTRQITDHYQKLCKTSKCDYLDELIKVLYIVHIKTLALVHHKNQHVKLDIRVPSGSQFVHACYLDVARELYKSPYLLSDHVDPYEHQKNLREVRQIIRQQATYTLRRHLPVRDIVTKYLDLNGPAPTNNEQVNVPIVTDSSKDIPYSNNNDDNKTQQPPIKKERPSDKLAKLEESGNLPDPMPVNNIPDLVIDDEDSSITNANTVTSNLVNNNDTENVPSKSSNIKPKTDNKLSEDDDDPSEEHEPKEENNVNDEKPNEEEEEEEPSNEDEPNEEEEEEEEPSNEDEPNEENEDREEDEPSNDNEPSKENGDSEAHRPSEENRDRNENEDREEEEPDTDTIVVEELNSLEDILDDLPSEKPKENVSELKTDNIVTPVKKAHARSDNMDLGDDLSLDEIPKPNSTSDVLKVRRSSDPNKSTKKGGIVFFKNAMPFRR